MAMAMMTAPRRRRPTESHLDCFLDEGCLRPVLFLRGRAERNG